MGLENKLQRQKKGPQSLGKRKAKRTHLEEREGKAWHAVEKEETP